MQEMLSWVGVRTPTEPAGRQVAGKAYNVQAGRKQTNGEVLCVQVWQGALGMGKGMGKKGNNNKNGAMVIIMV